MSLASMFRRQQLLRFLVVGTFNTLASYLIYVVLLWFGSSYAVANLVSIVLGIPISFMTQGRFVFGDSRPQRLWRFALCWAAIYGVNILLIGRLIGAGFTAYAAGALCLPVTTLCSYLVQKYIVFEPGAQGCVAVASDDKVVP